MTVRFSNQLVAELYQPFWAAWQAGEFLTDANGAKRRLDALKPCTNRVLTKLDRIAEGPLGCVSAGQRPFSSLPRLDSNQQPSVSDSPIQGSNSDDRSQPLCSL